jgi:hypothetical protein
MDVSFEFAALQRLAVFLATPHLLSVMGSLEHGREPYGALERTAPEQIDVAVRRLLEVGAVRLVLTHDDRMEADPHVPRCPLALTRKGRDVLQLIRDLHDPPMNASASCEYARTVQPSEQFTER